MKPYRPRKSRRRTVMPPGTVDRFPTTPGFWVQWSGRTDWQPITEHTYRTLQKILAGNGDRIVEIAAPNCEGREVRTARGDL